MRGLLCTLLSLAACSGELVGDRPLPDHTRVGEALSKGLPELLDFESLEPIWEGSQSKEDVLALLYQRGDFKKILELSEEIKPTAEIAFLRAEAHSRLGSYEAADLAYAQAFELAEDPAFAARVRYNQAHSALIHGQVEASSRLLQPLTEEKSWLGSAARVLSARVLLTAGNYAEAIALLEDIEQPNELAEIAKYLSAFAQVRTGQSETALRNLQSLSSSGTLAEEGALLKAWAQFELGETELSFRTLTPLIGQELDQSSARGLALILTQIVRADPSLNAELGDLLQPSVREAVGSLFNAKVLSGSDTFKPFACVVYAHILWRTPDRRPEARELLKLVQTAYPDSFAGDFAALVESEIDSTMSFEERSLLFERLLQENTEGALRRRALFSQAGLVREWNPPQARNLYAEVAVGGSDELAKNALFNARLLGLTSTPGVADKLAAEKSAEDRDLELEAALRSKGISSSSAAETLRTYLIKVPDGPQAVEVRTALVQNLIGGGPAELVQAEALLEDEGSVIEQRSLLTAKLLEKQGKLTEAIELLERSLADTSSSPLYEERLKLSELYTKAGQFNKARLSLRSLVQDTDKAPEAQEAAYFLSALNAVRSGTVQAREEALELYSKVISFDGPLRSLAAIERLSDLAQLGRTEKAYQESIDLLPDTARLFPYEERVLQLLSELARRDPKIADRCIDELLERLNGGKGRPLWLRTLAECYLFRANSEQRGPHDLREAILYFDTVLDAGLSQTASREVAESAGIKLIAILESQERWEAALRAAERTAKLEGPNLGDVRETRQLLKLRVTALR